MTSTKVKKFTKEHVLEFINSFTYKIIKIEWKNNLRESSFILKCEKCNQETVINKIHNFIDHTGCLYCKGLKHNNETIKAKLDELNYDLIGDFISTTKPMTVRCRTCQYEKTYVEARSAFTKTITSKINSCQHCNQIKLTLEQVQKLCLKQNITFLDGYYHGVIAKHNFMCDKEHIFISSVGAVIARDRKCDKCYRFNVNEKKLKELLFITFKNLNIEPQYTIYEKIYNENIKIRDKLITDFYIEKINCIIEYNGHQHYRPVRYGNNTVEISKLRFENQKIRDFYLKCYCYKHKIFLIEIDGREFFGKKLEKYFIDILVPEIKSLIKNAGI